VTSLNNANGVKYIPYQLPSSKLPKAHKINIYTSVTVWLEDKINQ